MGAQETTRFPVSQHTGALSREPPRTRSLPLGTGLAFEAMRRTEALASVVHSEMLPLPALASDLDDDAPAPSFALAVPAAR